jgi:cytochrome b pre-mRNA-processing protein 3
MILNKLFARKPTAAQRLYEAIVADARQEKFYAEMDVPDTLDGRFDMIVLHMFLVLDRLRGEAADMGQQLTDTFFKDLDRTLREMGIGDLSVAKKIRPMAEAFAGRMRAYATASEEGVLVEALQRNVYGGTASPKASELAQWMQNAKVKLGSRSTKSILDGELGLK